MANRSNQGASEEREKGQQQTVAGSGASGGAAASPSSQTEQERPMEVSRENEPRGVQAGESSGAQRGVQQDASQGMQQQGAERGALSAQRQPQMSSVLPAFMANPGLMASAFMANPFEFAELMTSEMDRIFENFGRGGGGSLSPVAGSALPRGGTPRGSALTAGQPGRRTAGGVTSFTPQMEVVQRGNEIVLRADLPGLRPEDVTVEIEDGVLAISGERREAAEDRREGFYHTERRYGSFYRAVPLPEGVSEEQINASFRDGVLEVTVPLPQAQEQQRARRIPVQGASGASAGGAQGGAQGSAQSGASAGGTGSGSPTNGDATISAG